MRTNKGKTYSNPDTPVKVLLALLSCEKITVNENMIEFYILTEPVK